MTKSLIKHKRTIILCILLLIAFFFRIYNLNWDQGHFLHPDERLYVNISNISLPSSLQQFFHVDSPLNPKMFYYGSFPLYLYKLVTIIFPFSSFLITSRLLSALFSFFTIPLIYLIGKKIHSSKLGILSSIVFAFSAGSIQHAHFNTTESMLVFFVSLATYWSILYAHTKKMLLLVFLAVLTGLSYATKVTGLTFALIPALALFFHSVKENRYKQLLAHALLFIVITLITGVIAAPYQIIANDQFLSEQRYMQSVTYGKDKPPFVIIYEGTIPYLYPIIHILPYTFGFLVLPLAIVGVGFLIRNLKKHPFYLFILLYPLLYFLWSGMWFAKFSRYYMLLFPFLSLWAAYALLQFSKKMQFVFLSIIVLQGVLFMSVYLSPNTRIFASEWIYQNIPKGTTLAGEHWDDNLPLPRARYGDTNEYKIVQLQSYDTEDAGKIEKMSATISESEYLILSSRRVYASILKNKKIYPYTANMYEQLFSEKLGYQLVQSFTSYPYVFSDNSADESFQSYDHPPVLIFKNIRHYSADSLYKEMLRDL